LWISPYTWITRGLKRTVWKDDEVVPFWFAEAYVLLWFVPLGATYAFAPQSSLLFQIGMALAGFRLVDMSFAIASIILFEPKRRSDDLGGYILARDRSRWVLLTSCNLFEIMMYFAFFHVHYGSGYDPEVVSKIAALYQSAAMFVASGGATATTDATYTIGLLNLLMFLLFFLLAVPTVFSLIRARERTTEVLGKGANRDPRA
jgi:hypothetical protein